MSEWISVEDKLPEGCENVLVCNFETGTRIDCTTAWYHVKNKHWDVDDSMIRAENYDGGAVISLDQNVTHWMPIPEPPS